MANKNSPAFESFIEKRASRIAAGTIQYGQEVAKEFVKIAEKFEEGDELTKEAAEQIDNSYLVPLAVLATTKIAAEKQAEGEAEKMPGRLARAGAAMKSHAKAHGGKYLAAAGGLAAGAGAMHALKKHQEKSAEETEKEAGERLDKLKAKAKEVGAKLKGAGGRVVEHVKGHPKSYAAGAGLAAGAAGYAAYKHHKDSK